MHKILKNPNYRHDNGDTYIFTCQLCGFENPNSAIPYGVCLECGEDYKSYLSFGDSKKQGIDREEVLKGIKKQTYKKVAEAYLI